MIQIHSQKHNKFIGFTNYENNKTSKLCKKNLAFSQKIDYLKISKIQSIWHVIIIT